MKSTYFLSIEDLDKMADQTYLIRGNYLCFFCLKKSEQKLCDRCAKKVTRSVRKKGEEKE